MGHRIDHTLSASAHELNAVSGELCRNLEQLLQLVGHDEGWIGWV